MSEASRLYSHDEMFSRKKINKGKEKKVLLLNLSERPEVGAHTFNPITLEALSEFEAILVYTASSRTARTTGEERGMYQISEDYSPLLWSTSPTPALVHRIYPKIQVLCLHPSTHIASSMPNIPREGLENSEQIKSLLCSDLP